MPLAPNACGITSGREELRQRDFPCGQSFSKASQWHRVSARSNGETASHQSRTRRCALRLDVEVQQPRALTRQLVDPRSRGATKDTSSINAQFAIAQII